MEYVAMSSPSLCTVASALIGMGLAALILRAIEPKIRRQA